MAKQVDVGAIGSYFESLSDPRHTRNRKHLLVDVAIAERLEIRHTPKHGSWLNMAEIELSALARRCLDRRIESREELEREVAAWEEDRNERSIGVDWRFTTADARIKLRHLYPATQAG